MIVIYFHFQKISNRILRVIIFGLFAFFSLKKIIIFDESVFEILYFIYLVFILEVSLQSSPKTKEKINKKRKKRLFDLYLKLKKKKN